MATAKTKTKDIIAEKLDQLIDIEKRVLEQKTQKPEEAVLTKPIKLEAKKEEKREEVLEAPESLSYKDIAKASIGAIIGSLLHYTLIYGVAAAENLSMLRAHILLPTSFLVAVVFLYFSGFKRYSRSIAIKSLPIKVFFIYLTALLIAIAVLYLFYPDYGTTFTAAYKQVAAASLLAVIGASITDLVGKG